MPDIESSNKIRFFANSSLFKQPKACREYEKDPTPFGLEYQEDFNKKPGVGPQDKVSMNPSPTNLPQGSDSCVDFDVEL